MAGVATPALAAAVSNTGGLGSLGCADLAPEPAPETREALEEASTRADESSQEAFEATLEPEEVAPEEGAMHAVPEPEPEPAEAAASDEDVSLESIVEELKRREGRG